MNPKIDKNALALRIKSLEGLTADEKSALLGLLNSRKKYGLVWEEKEEAVEELLRVKLPVLTEVKEKRIIAKDSDSAPDHILIEGDNLHALTALQYTHAGKVDVIYIDPPYNTGNKDFVYNDSYVDKEDSFRHSKWLSFMSKRLRIAKGLLKESGVIFVSIDENEQAQLKLLCDEVFGEECFVTDVIWRSADSSNNDSKQFSLDHNHTLVFSKASGWQPFLLERTEKNNLHYKNPDNDPNGPWFSGNVSSPKPRKNLAYEVISPRGNRISPPKNGWRWGEERMKEMIDSGEIVFSKDESNIVKKTYLKDQKGLAPSSLWSDIEETGHNRNAKYELIKLFPDYHTSELFPTPKPTKFIRKILKLTMHSDVDSLILDFFAGSGTTLHATMALNAEDGGNRRCILVTNNENSICEEVTYERNKRVIQGYTKQNDESVPGLTNNNLRYYKTDFIDREPSMKNRKALTRAAVDLLCIRENCYTPYKQYDSKEIRIFTGKQCELIIIYDPTDIDTAIETIEKLYPGKKKRGEKPRCKVYVFSPGHYAYDEEFDPVLDKIELCALPEAIYRAYKAVLPKAKRKFLDEVEQEGAAS